MSSGFLANSFVGKSALVAILLLLVAGCNVKPEQKKENPLPVETVANELPPILLIRENGEQFSAKTLSGKTILIFFGATCDHCQREASQIHDHLKAFEQYTLYFIAMDPFPVINQFADQFGISGQPNIRFMRADGASVDRSLGYVKTPTIFVYDGQGKLVHRFNGETPVENILAVL